MKPTIDRRTVLKASAFTGISLMTGIKTAWAQQIETQGLAEVEAAARKEGKFVWYDSIPSDQGKAVIEAFGRKYPEIRGEFVELSTTQRVARINQESNAGGPTADFFTDLPEIAMKLVDQGFARAVDWKAMGIEPSQEKTPNPHLLLTHATPCVFIYNTRNVPDADVPRTYEDTLKPRWKGRGGMWSIPFGPIQMIETWGENGVSDYFKKLAELQVRLYTGSRALAEGVGAGELDIGYFVPYNGVVPAINKGAPIGVLWIQPVAVGTLYGVLPKYGTNPNASKLFLSWIASLEGARIWEQVTARGNPYVEGTEMNKLMAGRKLSRLPTDRMVADSDKLNGFGVSLVRMIQGR